MYYDPDVLELVAKENKKSGALYTVEFKIKDGVAIGKHTAVTES